MRMSTKITFIAIAGLCVLGPALSQGQPRGDDTIFITIRSNAIGTSLSEVMPAGYPSVLSDYPDLANANADDLAAWLESLGAEEVAPGEYELPAFGWLPPDTDRTCDPALWLPPFLGLAAAQGADFTETHVDGEVAVGQSVTSTPFATNTMFVAQGCNRSVYESNIGPARLRIIYGLWNSDAVPALSLPIGHKGNLWLWPDEEREFRGRVTDSWFGQLPSPTSTGDVHLGIFALDPDTE